MKTTHECIQDERIRNLQQRLDKLEERVDSIKELMEDMRDFQTRLTWLIFGLFGTSVITLITVLFKR